MVQNPGGYKFWFKILVSSIFFPYITRLFFLGSVSNSPSLLLQTPSLLLLSLFSSSNPLSALALHLIFFNPNLEWCYSLGLGLAWGAFLVVVGEDYDSFVTGDILEGRWHFKVNGGEVSPSPFSYFLPRYHHGYYDPSLKWCCLLGLGLDWATLLAGVRECMWTQGKPRVLKRESLKLENHSASIIISIFNSGSSTIQKLERLFYI